MSKEQFRNEASHVLDQLLNELAKDFKEIPFTEICAEIIYIVATKRREAALIERRNEK